MRHLFILFSGYVLRPRGVAIRDRTILFEISFKFFFAHRNRLPLFTAHNRGKSGTSRDFSGRQKTQTYESR